ncbi:hypothetical protein AB0N65_17740 [Paenarthrobacter sp. NPDC089322]|uniref:hypothetical protein n=1 Tax=Paenarthrobacter sp. NPDC089322 TaxID=3155065 RepID=UPI00344ACE55
MTKARSAVVRSVALVSGSVLAASLMGACSGTPKLDVKASCEFLNNDTFKPDGNQQQQSKQIAAHYHEISEKLAPEIGEPIKKMAAIMDEAAASSLGAATQNQQQQLSVQFNKIGEYCK